MSTADKTDWFYAVLLGLIPCLQSLWTEIYKSIKCDTVSKEEVCAFCCFSVMMLTIMHGMNI